MKKSPLILLILFLLCAFQNVSAQKKTAKPKKAKPIIVSCGVCTQKAIYLPKPEYPKVARFIRASGEVQVEILIDEKGNIESAKAISGHVLLQPAAVKAALKAKFKPFKLSGKPVKVRGILVYNFVPKI
jgi:TonB family protein